MKTCSHSNHGLLVQKKKKVIYCSEFMPWTSVIKSHFALWNFLMEAHGNKRHSASPWESSEVKPGNDNGLSRHKQLAYPSEYSRWCPSHLCCTSYIFASAHTDDGGRGHSAAVVDPKWFPCVSNFLFSKKPLVQCISHNLCLSSLVPRLTSTNRLTLQAYVHMAALIVILHGGAL